MKRVIPLLVLLFGLVGCLPGIPGSKPAPAQFPTLPPSPVDPDRAAAAPQVAKDFLQAWKNENYDQMYALVTAITRDALSLEDFREQYQDVAASLTLDTLEYEILSALSSSASAQVGYRVNFHTRMLGDIQRQMVMNLTWEHGKWRIGWEQGLILSELKGGNFLNLEISVPARGSINDRNGQALAAMAEAVALGVVPGEIDPAKEDLMLSELAEITGKSEEEIQALYSDAPSDWYIPVGEVSSEVVQKHYETLASLTPGLRMDTFRARYYYDGLAPHVTGYLQPIFAEEVEEYTRRGYLVDEKVGKAGLELWGEEYLRGKPKASLYVIDPQGNIVTRLSQSEAQPAQSIVTTIDKDLQLKIQRSMGDYRGAVVVMERDSGRILAMVSSPSFDANLFEPTNYNSILLDQLYNDPGHPMINRATQGQYPLGSVFKVITMSAALESGEYTPYSEYLCGYVFNELSVPLYDWTYGRGIAASGLLTLPGGLIRSCNPWFWHIGLDLYNQPDHQMAVTEMARGFGLGSLTGLGQLPELVGSVPEPTNESEAVQQAIGQGTLLVTPLQVASFIAAVGNGGTLYQPSLVEKIAFPDGNPVYSFKPIERSRLPISAENLEVVQKALLGVVSSTEPLGTAHFVLANLPFPVAGKTGTAQTPQDEPHAWFAGYTLADREDLPDIAVVVLLENAGEGSEKAAPLFGRIAQLYFSENQNPGAVLPWESTWYVPAEPTPEPTLIPTP